MNAVVLEIDKPVEINRKENLRDHRLYWIGRRTQDVVLSPLALMALSPVMLATAIAIVVDDPSAGPIFSQERVVEMENCLDFISFAPCVQMQKLSWMSFWNRMRWMARCSRSKMTHALLV